MKKRKIDVKLITPITKESKQAKKSAILEYEDHPLDFSAIKLLTNSYHRRALSFKATCTVGIGHKIYRGKEPLDEDDYPKIFKQANPNEDFVSVLTSVALDYFETGNGYLEIVRNVKKEIAELYWIPSETVYIAKNKDSFYQIVDNKKVKFNRYGNLNSDTSEVIHFRYPSNRSTFYGLPDWVDCVGPILLDYYAVEWNYRFFENNAIPPFAIIVEGGSLTTETEKKIKEFLESKLKGIENQHRALVISARGNDVKIRFEEIMKKIKDGEFMKLREQLRDEIISAHGVPPRILGVVAPGSLGGSGEALYQLKIFKEITIRPHLKVFESVLNKTLFKEHNLKIKFEEIDITPFKDDVEETTKLVQSGILEPNEGRQRLGIEKSSHQLKKQATQLLKEILALRKILKQYDLGIETHE